MLRCKENIKERRELAGGKKKGAPCTFIVSRDWIWVYSTVTGMGRKGKG